jgi:DNA gyrase subunit B
VEQAALMGALKSLVTADDPDGPIRAAALAERMNAIAEETERGWTGRTENGGYILTRELRGVRQAIPLDAALIASAEARRLDEHAKPLREAFAGPAVFIRRGDETPISGPSELLEAINAAGRKGVTVQRYKGLGEMNKDQLWETTLDREARSLLQVKIREVDDADDIFVKLMGDVVEPRREFIQENALNVANLDV